MRQQLRRQSDLAAVVAVDGRRKQRVRAGLGQAEQAQLREATGAAGGSRPAEARLQLRGVGQVNGGAVQADQPTPALQGW